MDFFLKVLLIVIGYFILFSVVMARSENKRAISVLALWSLLIYGCVVGMLLVAGQYLGETGLLFYAVAIIYSCLYWLWKLYMLRKEKPRFQIGCLLTLAAYLLAVLYVTSFMREGGSNFTVQMELFNWMGENGVEDYNHFLLNIAMFVPVGLLFPLVTGGRGKKFLPAVSFGLLFTVVIETGQLLLHSGTCDIDDILSNTLGTALGALAIGLWGSREAKKNKEN